MAIETLVVDGVVSFTNLSGATVANLNAQDTNWATVVDNTTGTDLQVSMQNPVNPPTVGAGLQTIRVQARKAPDAAGSTATFTIAINQGGVDILTSPAYTVTSATGEVFDFTFDASVVTDPNNLRVHLVGLSSGGKPADRRTVGFGYVAWLAETAAAPTSVNGNASGVLGNLVSATTLGATASGTTIINANGAGSLSPLILTALEGGAVGTSVVNGNASGSLEAITTSALSATASSVAGGPQKLIWDSDVDSDVDDVIALGIAAHLHHEGEIELLAVTLHTQATWTPHAAKTLLKQAGLNQIPVGASRTAFGDTGSLYSTDISFMNLPRYDRTQYPDAVEVLRTQLAAQPNGSVKIATGGGLGNIEMLLKSPADGISPLTGMELVTAKVESIHIMFEAQTTSYGSGGGNLLENEEAGKYVVENCPVPLFHTDGNVASLGTASVTTTYTVGNSDPNYDAYYRAWLEYGVQEKFAHDTIALMDAIRGPITDYYTYSEPGNVTIDTTANQVTWTPDANGKSRYLIRNDTTDAGGDAFSAYLQTLVDAFSAAFEVSGRPSNPNFELEYKFEEGTGQVVNNVWPVKPLEMDGFTEANLNATIGADATVVSGEPTWIADGVKIGSTGVKVPYSPHLDKPDYSIVAVIKPTSFGTWNSIATQDASIGTRRFQFRIASDGSIQFFVRYSGTTLMSAQSVAGVIKLNEWAMVTAHVFGLAIQVRVNGVVVATATLPDDANWGNSLQPLIIGARNETANTDLFRGDFRYFSWGSDKNETELLAQEQLARDFSSANGITIPSAGTDATANGSLVPITITEMVGSASGATVISANASGSLEAITASSLTASSTGDAAVNPSLTSTVGISALAGTVSGDANNTVALTTSVTVTNINGSASGSSVISANASGSLVTVNVIPLAVDTSGSANITTSFGPSVTTSTLTSTLAASVSVSPSLNTVTITSLSGSATSGAGGFVSGELGATTTATPLAAIPSADSTTSGTLATVSLTNINGDATVHASITPALGGTVNVSELSATLTANGSTTRPLQNITLAPIQASASGSTVVNGNASGNLSERVLIETLGAELSSTVDISPNINITTTVTPLSVSISGNTTAQGNLSTVTVTTLGASVSASGSVTASLDSLTLTDSLEATVAASAGVSTTLPSTSVTPLQASASGSSLVNANATGELVGVSATNLETTVSGSANVTQPLNPVMVAAINAVASGGAGTVALFGPANQVEKLEAAVTANANTSANLEGLSLSALDGTSNGHGNIDGELTTTTLTTLAANTSGLAETTISIDDIISISNLNGVASASYRRLSRQSTWL